MKVAQQRKVPLARQICMRTWVGCFVAALAVVRESEALASCTCDCCRVELQRDEGDAASLAAAGDRLECSFIEPGLLAAIGQAGNGPSPVEAAAEPHCAPLCDRGDTEAILFAAESSEVDTERFCFFACAPVRRLSAEPGEGLPPDPAPGDLCRPLTQGEAEAVESSDATGNGAAPMEQWKVASQFLARRPRPPPLLSAAALSRHSALARAAGLQPVSPAPAPSGAPGPPPVTPWDSLSEKAKQGNAEIMKMAEAADAKAVDAEKAAKTVEELSSKATDALPVALADTEQARQSAEDANKAEKLVRAIRDQVRKMARKEAMGYIPEVLAKVKRIARKRAWVEARTLAAFETKQLVQEGEEAAVAARKPYEEAEKVARQYADGWAKHGTDLMTRSQALEAQAHGFEANNVQQLSALYDAAGDKQTANRLKQKVKTLLREAAAARDQAGEAFRTAASIQKTLPLYEREAEQSAFSARATLDLEALPPAPLLSVS